MFFLYTVDYSKIRRKPMLPIEQLAHSRLISGDSAQQGRASLGRVSPASVFHNQKGKRMGQVASK